MSKPEKKIGIIGATGYTGSELVRILGNHEDVEVSVITSESRAGERFSSVHPFFTGIADHELMKAESVDDYQIDLAFLALPHGVSMEFVKKFRSKPFSIIDLSGDFRLDSPATYEAWYGKEHTYPEGFREAVYGIPELYKEEMMGASLVANPGCYPTSAILGLAPLLKAGLVESETIIVDSKSGTTGAGVKTSPVTHFSNVNENFKAYGLKKHRHTIEIQNTLSKFSGKDVKVQFTPHLLPIDRGILSTMYARPSGKVSENLLRELYTSFYQSAPFIRIRDKAPGIKDVRGTNFCDIHITYDDRTDMVMVVSVIDNLVKGAAGQGVQNMNIMFGWEERKGLQQVPLYP